MNISTFMGSNIVNIQRIIANLPNRFNSHDFIEKFAKEFEPNYIDFLQQYRGSGAFLTVHSQIAKFLSENSESLEILKTEKVRNKNIFGDDDEIQGWIKNS